MSNKVKLDRFERDFPKTDSFGVLIAKDGQLTYENPIDKAISLGKSTIANGMQISYDGNPTTITVQPGSCICNQALIWQITPSDNSLQFDQYYPLWDIDAKYPMKINGSITDIYSAYDDYVNKDSIGGCDYSVSNYTRWNMTSNTTPYGVAYTDKPHALVTYSPWKAFTGASANEADSWICTDPITNVGGYPVILMYSLSSDGSKSVKPTSFYIHNRNTSGVGIASPSRFLIQGSQAIKPTNDDYDWETIVNVDGTAGKIQSTAQNAGATYGTNVFESGTEDKFYRHFRLKITAVAQAVTFVAVARFEWTGVTNSSIPLNNPTRRYYLARIKNKETGIERDLILISKEMTPIVSDKDELLGFRYLTDNISSDLYRRIWFDYVDDKKYVNITQPLSITINTSMQPRLNATCYLYISIDKTTNEYSLYVSDAVNKIYDSNKLYNLLNVMVTKTDNALVIAKTRNMTDIVNQYNDRFIVSELLGQTGYRLYSDGYKEQWGTLANPIFPIAFEEIPYIVERGATNVSKTGMTIGVGYWMAKGY